MPVVNRLETSIENDDEYHKVLVKRQTENDRNHDTLRNYALLPIGSTVAVQWGDGDRWTHGTVVGKGYHNHNNRFYIIHATKTVRMITRKRKQCKGNTNHS